MKDRVAQGIGWAILIVVAVLVIVSIKQTLEVRSFANDLRASALEGCVRQNEVRSAIRTFLRADIRDSRNIPPEFFPGIPPDEFERLIREQALRTRESIATLSDVDCAAEYPSE